MKILFIHPDDPSLELTWSRTPSQLAVEFRKNGHEVCFVKTKPSGGVLNFFLLVTRYITRHDYTYSMLFRKIAAIKIKKAIKLNQPSVLLHFGTTANVTFLNSSIPSYLYCDYSWNLLNTFGAEYYNPRPPKWKIKIIDEIAKKDYKKFSAIFCQSNFVKDNLFLHYGVPASKLILTRVGIRFTEKDVQTSNRDPKLNLLFVARDAFGKKGGNLLYSAFIFLKKKYDIPFKLIYEGGGAEGIVAPNSDIEIRGLSSTAELYKLYNTAFALVMPSIAEPMGLVFLEALAFGVPILGLKRGALPDIVCNGKYGFLVEDESPEQLAEKIYEMFCNREDTFQKALLGSEYVLKEYNWATVANLMINAF